MAGGYGAYGRGAGAAGLAYASAYSGSRAVSASLYIKNLPPHVRLLSWAVQMSADLNPAESSKRKGPPCEGTFAICVLDAKLLSWPPVQADKLFLYEHFAPMGAILSVRVLTDENGTCRGVGFVNYNDPRAAASAAASLNGEHAIVFPTPPCSRAGIIKQCLRLQAWQAEQVHHQGNCWSIANDDTCAVHSDLPM